MQLRASLDQDATLITAWSISPTAEIASALAACAFDAVTVDMQHGGHDEASAFSSATAIHAAGKPAILRIPLGRNDLASRGLDMGFEAVIAPMINSEADALEFARAMKYPPLGDRSWGPMRALQLHSRYSPQSYFASANRDTLALAMIETRAAYAALDEILAVEGIDGVFVGPSDLSISWSGGLGVDPGLADMQAAVVDIARRSRAAGKVAAIFLADPATTQKYSQMGYRLVALNTDPAALQAGAALMLGQARG